MVIPDHLVSDLGINVVFDKHSPEICLITLPFTDAASSMPSQAY